MRAGLLLGVVALSLTIASVAGAQTLQPLPCKSAESTGCTAAEAPAVLLGTWELNVQKSQYSPGPPLRAESRVYRRTADGVTGVVSRTYASGEMERYEYIANFGGEYMVTGTPAYDAVKLTRLTELSSEALLTHAGMIYGVARRVIAADGRSMTITFDRKDNDHPVHNVAVYDKVN